MESRRTIPQNVVDLQNKALDELEPTYKAKLNELENRLEDVAKFTQNSYCLLRWLKARKYDVKAAEAMYRSTLNWRNQLRIDNINEEFQAPQVLEKYLPVTIIGHDREGCPLWLFLLGNMDSKGLLHSCKKMDIIKNVVFNLEKISKDMVDQSEKKNQLIERHIVVVDLDNFDVKQSLWKPIFDLYASIMTMYEANYPESLKAALLINAPRYFSVFWVLIKQFLSEETRTKVTIYGKDNWQDTLLDYVDENQLPKHWGGILEDEIDGNPYYSSKICMGGPVPKSYYHPEMLINEGDLCTMNIAMKDKFKLEFDVDEPGSTINWTFKTTLHDICFGIKYTPTSGPNGSKSITEVLPIERVNCHLVPEEGSWICKDAGKYTLVFDNSFSWLTSKTLMYMVQLVPPLTSNGSESEYF